MHTKPKKSLGQNFLIDQNIQKKIISACKFCPMDTVLEIGSGRGELTRLVRRQVKKVYAVEIDPALSSRLDEVFSGEEQKVEVINQDILKFNLQKQLRGLSTKIKILGNIPYYISTPIIEYIIQYRGIIDEAFLTVQREFASRITASSGTKDFGALSCFVQYYTEPGILFIIKKRSFFPAPRVDSTFLRLKILDKPAVKVEDQERFFKIIRAAFNQRRKILRNSLRGLVAQERLDRFFSESKIDRNIRPERLSLQDFANLSKK